MKSSEETGNACNIFIGKFQWKGLCVRPRYRWEGIMKMDSKGIMGCQLELTSTCGALIVL